MRARPFFIQELAPAGGVHPFMEPSTPRTGGRFLDAARERLFERRRALFEHREGLEEDIRSLESDRDENELDEHAQEDVIARLLAGLEDRDQRELREIQYALGRIANGTYDVCERCGGNMSRERLEAVPHTRHCVECGREAEAENDRGRARTKTGIRATEGPETIDAPGADPQTQPDFATMSDD
jgi:RNA polymerase-binding transcription factor DksA